MMRRGLLLLSLLSLAAAQLAPLRASAQQDPAPKKAAPKPGDDRDLRALKQQGEVAMLSLHYRNALVAYEKAYALSREPGLLYNMARAYQGLERYPEALSFLERFRQEAPPSLRERVPQLDDMLEDLRRRVATLSLEVSQAGARIRLRGEDVGRSPLPAPLQVRAGTALLEIELDGFAPLRRELTLEGGQRQSLQLQLVPLDLRGTLALQTIPAGATVKIDGASFGISPLEAPLRPGTHRLALEHSGALPLETEILIEPGQRRELRLTLERRAPVTSRWWFWTGVGALVLGGVVLTYALTTEKEAPRGSIEPGRIQNPLLRF